MTEANIYQRLHACMAAAKRIGKERKQGIQWEIVSHDAVTDAVRPLLVEHGIVAIPTVTNRGQNGNRTEVDVRVDFVNIDRPDDRVGVDVFGYGIDQQDKGPGKAMSYAVKYALLKTLALGTGEDAENDSQMHKPGDTKPEQPKAPPGMKTAGEALNGGKRSPDPRLKEEADAYMLQLEGALEGAGSIPELRGIWEGGSPRLFAAMTDQQRQHLTNLKDSRRQELLAAKQAAENAGA